jgi:hypothetical protein
MSKYLICCIAFCMAALSLQAQQVLTAPYDDEMYFWKILSKVKSKTTFDPKTNNVFYEPIFSKGIENLAGKTIAIKGYMIPADMARGKLTLSAYPFSSCFFCGQAGPESVIEIEAKVPIIYRMDRPVTVQGKLKLNRNDDPFRLLYILENAEQYSGD